MLISILIIAILILIFVVIGMNSLSDRIMNLEVTLDGIKEKTDKLGTNTYNDSHE
jgi:uncharacterized protein YoxC